MGILGGPTIQSFTVELDNDHTLCGQGELLRGRVKLNIAKGKLKAKNVRLIITGQCNIRYQKEKVNDQCWTILKNTFKNWPENNAINVVSVRNLKRTKN